MIRKLISTIVLIFLAYAPVSAQLAHILIGPREGDSPWIIYADPNEVIDVDMWFRTAPDISIMSYHIPLSSNNDYIPADSRQGGEYLSLYGWDVSFLDPQPDPEHAGYTNQSIVGAYNFQPDCEMGITTQGQWWWIASFRMTTSSLAPTGSLLCDALIEGFDIDFTGAWMADCNLGPLDRSDFHLDFACLWINEVACSEYTMGDFNGSGAFNVADIVDSYSKLKTGLPEPASICECPAESGDFWAVAADVNNSCAFNVADVVDGYSFLKTGSPEPEACWLCPPGEP